MKITKFDHSCVVIEKNERNIVIDPVEFTSTIPDIINVDAIIITHKHGDHFQPIVLDKILSLNPNARLFIAEDMVGLTFHSAEIAQINHEINLGEFSVKFFGKDHAPIVDNISPCKNYGVIIDGIFVNPGDSFDIVPINNPDVLLVAISAPWLKVEETMDYIKKVKPKRVIPIHDALLSPMGHTITDNWVIKACAEIGAEYTYLQSGDNISI